MSSNLIKLGLLALVSSTMAVPMASGSALSYLEAGNGTDVDYATATASGRRHRGYKTGTGLSSRTAKAAAASSSVCTSQGTVYETKTNLVTVTMTVSAGASESPVAPVSYAASASSSSAPSFISAAAATSSIEAEAAKKPSRYSSSRPASASAPVSSAASSVASSSAALNPIVSVVSSVASIATEAASSSSAPAPSSFAASVSSLVASATSAAASPSSTYTAPSSGGSSSKRGLPYNTASLTNCFKGSKVSWAYNWGSVSSGLDKAFEYVPMLWGPGSDKTNTWKKDAQAAIDAGSTHLLAFNEPDHTEQANVSPAVAATGYKTYMNDMFGGKGIKLGSPAVTNGPAPMGLDWLNKFMTACSGCQVDFVNIHWYDSATNLEYFKKHVQDAHAQTGKPVWITEFGASGSDDQVKTFLAAAIPWLDSQSFVERYSYFMVSEGLLVKGSSMSSVGSTYASA